MSRYFKGTGFIAVLLVIIMAAIAVIMWTLDLVIQQRTFSFLLSAELIAFAMVVYLYYGETAQEVSRRWLFIGAIALAVVLVLSVAAIPGITIT